MTSTKDTIGRRFIYLKKVAWYEKAMQDMKKSGKDSFEEYFNLYTDMDEYLFSKISGYKESNIQYKKDKKGQLITDKEGNRIIDGYRVYPSDRMFNFIDVWQDWFNDSLPQDISLAGQFGLSIIVDAVAFILICLIF